MIWRVYARRRPPNLDTVTRLLGTLGVLVLCGAVINIGVLWCFDMRRVSLAIVSGTLALFIGAIIYMIAVLDEPYRGAHALRPVGLLEAMRDGMLH